jgi:transposase InsO family protein
MVRRDVRPSRRVLVCRSALTQRAWFPRSAAEVAAWFRFVEDTPNDGPFDEVFPSEGIRTVKTHVRAPQTNAIAERFVRTVRAECLDWLLILNRRHLERVLRVYVDH